jgi:hypothetical protein
VSHRPLALFTFSMVSLKNKNFNFDNIQCVYFVIVLFAYVFGVKTEALLPKSDHEDLLQVYSRGCIV